MTHTWELCILLGFVEAHDETQQDKNKQQVDDMET